MMKLWKLFFAYWLYNQSFFILTLILLFAAAIIINIPLAPIFDLLDKYLYKNSSFYLSIIFSIAACIISLYRIFKSYWQKFILNYNDNWQKLLYAAIFPIITASILFSAIFYINNGTINDIIVLLSFIHLSFFFTYITRTIYLNVFILIFLITNLLPLVFFIRYVYLYRQIKISFFKPCLYTLIIFIFCGTIINYALDNSNIVRSHNFAYENGLSSVDLKKYKITNPGNILPKLNEVSTLQLTQEEWLKLDGAEAAYPVYSAYANACYDDIAKYQYNQDTLPWQEQNKINEEFEKYVAFNNTVYAFKDLINKRCDVFFGAMPSKQQQADAAALGEELVLTPIAQEAFVFFVSSDNPVSSLTTQQVRDIYSGKTKNWQPLGGDDRRILAFQRPEGSGSQTLLQHIMGDTPIMEPLEEECIGSMGGIGTQVAEYNGDAGALGFSFKFFLTGMLGREDAPVKMLAIDGVYPTDENIRSCKYPFTTILYAITLKSNTKPQLDTFLNWMQSPQGQELAEKVGYVRLQ